jgi:hypothetical protein
MVRLDVAVTRHGLPVPGLEAKDFAVRDNGVPQRIELVAREEKHVHAVLVLDSSGSVAGERLARLKLAAHGLLGVLQPEDSVSLGGLSGSASPSPTWTKVK